MSSSNIPPSSRETLDEEFDDHLFSRDLSTKVTPRVTNETMTTRDLSASCPLNLYDEDHDDDQQHTRQLSISHTSLRLPAIDTPKSITPTISLRHLPVSPSSQLVSPLCTPQNPAHRGNSSASYRHHSHHHQQPHLTASTSRISLPYGGGRSGTDSCLTTPTPLALGNKSSSCPLLSPSSSMKANIEALQREDRRWNLEHHSRGDVLQRSFARPRSFGGSGESTTKIMSMEDVDTMVENLILESSGLLSSSPKKSSSAQRTPTLQSPTSIPARLTPVYGRSSSALGTQEKEERKDEQQLQPQRCHTVLDTRCRGEVGILPEYQKRCKERDRATEMVGVPSKETDDRTLAKLVRVHQESCSDDQTRLPFTDEELQCLDLEQEWEVYVKSKRVTGASSSSEGHDLHPVLGAQQTHRTSSALTLRKDTLAAHEKRYGRPTKKDVFPPP